MYCLNLGNNNKSEFIFQPSHAFPIILCDFFIRLIYNKKISEKTGYKNSILDNVPQVDIVMPDPQCDSPSPLYTSQQGAPPHSSYNLSALTQIAKQMRIDKGYQIDINNNFPHLPKSIKIGYCWIWQTSVGLAMCPNEKL